MLAAKFRLIGGGLTGELFRSIDWASHPLGPTQDWPIALLTSLQMLFHTQHPMFIWWGPELYQFYNDAYLPSFGRGKHPEAFGQRGEDCWPEIWSTIKPQIDLVMHEGGSTWHENQLLPIHRDGRLDDVYWSYGYSPIFDLDGRVAGTLVLCRETTEGVQLDAQLATEGQKLKAMIEQVPAGIALLRGPEFVFEKVNREWSDLVSQRKYLGRTFAETYPEANGALFVHHLQEVFRTGARYQASESMVHVEVVPGQFEDRYYDIRYVRVLDGQGVPYGVFAYSSNVTEKVLSRLRLESWALRIDQERARFIAAYQAVEEGIFIFDSQGEPVFMNDAAARVFGSESAEDLLRRVEYYFERLELRELNDELIPLSNWPIERALRGEGFRDWQIKAHRKDIDARWIWSSSGELVQQRGTDITLGVVVLRDITSQKMAEDELIQAKKEAENANELKTAFLANMSHEIRTPLGAILGFSEILKEPTLTAEEKEEYLQIISRNGKALTRIIDDILDLAKVESGKLEIEILEFPFFELLNDVLDLFRESVKAKGIYLMLDLSQHVPGKIFSDPTRLRQILINVIGNAVKFTQKGGVTVDFREIRHDRETSRFQVIVKDTGIGIPQEGRAKLFQPFVQADNSTTRKFGGSGLGLVLSHRLAKALGGDIVLEPDDGTEGCTFVISFVAPNPTVFAGQAAPKMTEPARPDVDLSGVRVLVADDSADNQLLVKTILARSGAQADFASDGAEAVRLAREKEYDLILMDLQMPVMDGYEATRSLRRRGYRKPVVALTAHAMAEERERTREAGCDKHLTKPIDEKELLTTIWELARKGPATSHSEGAF